MINKAILLGNLGKDPDVSQHGENYLIKFPLATSESWKDKNGEWQEETTWHNCEMWRKFPPKSLKKGSKVYCEGKFSVRKHEDKYFHSVKLQTLRNLTPQEPTQPTQQNKVVEDDDVLPF